ncbi:MAG TPA: hypothetical protein VFS45_01660 [Sphingomicrobium sp.]|nr:hypothetical protein [Sphingomicrobium sp.]
MPQPAPIQTGTSHRPWWETRPFVAALILLAGVPLLYPSIPPLVDLLGHIGRYRVQLDLDSSPWLGRYYGYAWQAIGNLGVDLLVEPLAKAIGLEPAVKLIVLAIPPMTVAGFLWVAREVHGRLPPTALLALPFAYSHPFMYGFVNYALSIALAFLAFGLWLRLARLGRLKLRAILFVPISFIVFFAHTFGWGMLGLMAFSAEAVRQHDRGIGWLRAGIRAAGHAVVMALPVLIIVHWRGQVRGPLSHQWFDLQLKLEALASVLRDRWSVLDIGSLALALAMIGYAIASRRLTLSRNLAFSALVLAAVFLLLPSMVFGSAFADMRLAPYMFAVALLAIRFRGATDLRLARNLAVLGLAFLLLRTGATTASLAIAADDQSSKLAALDHVPMGARVASIAGRGCGIQWPLQRNAHLGAMVIARRHGFSNDQWVIEGTNLLTLRYREPGIFAADPSQIVRPTGCRSRSWWIDRALERLPREHFDYVWLIDPPPFDPGLVAGLRPVWRGPGSVLYQVRP